MTENTTTEPAVVEVEEPTPTEPTTEPTTEPAEPEDKPGREAAGYRRKLRAAEAERDQLAGRVEAMQRARVEELAEAGQVTPKALWASGAQLADLLTDDGAVDPDKVSAALQSARDTLGLAVPRPGNYVPREGSIPAPPGRSTADTMAEIVAGRR